MKGVFEVSGNSRYDDFVSERYHFPSQYLKNVQRCVGDWIVYRETRASKGRLAYIAVAYVDRIEPDPADRTHFYARVSLYLEFDRHVPYRDATGRFAERFLRELPRAGDAGRALRGGSVRELEDDDFVAIVNRGLEATLDPSNRIRLELDPTRLDPATEQLLAQPPTLRRVEAMLINRKVRDANFRSHILAAYEDTCAVTGLRIMNGGGRAEAQAAHIWSVKSGGPDVVQNGIALSATAHWLFDRHLISFDDDFRLLVSHNKVPAELRQLFPPLGKRVRLPSDPTLQPAKAYVARHRELFAGHAAS